MPAFRVAASLGQQWPQRQTIPHPCLLPYSSKIVLWSGAKILCSQSIAYTRAAYQLSVAAKSKKTGAERWRRVYASFTGGESSGNPTAGQDLQVRSADDPRRRCAPLSTRRVRTSPFQGRRSRQSRRPVVGPRRLVFRQGPEDDRSGASPPRAGARDDAQRPGRRAVGLELRGPVTVEAPRRDCVERVPMTGKTTVLVNGKSRADRRRPPGIRARRLLEGREGLPRALGFVRPG